MRELNRRLEVEDGIEPMRPGEQRPDGYQLVDHSTGRWPYPAGTVEVDGLIVLPPNVSSSVALGESVVHRRLEPATYTSRIRAIVVAKEPFEISLLPLDHAPLHDDQYDDQ